MRLEARLPVAVIGGGPVGLAAAAQLVTRGLPVQLYERGATAAANVRSWSHVRLFSPWRFNVDAAAAALLQNSGWREPLPGVLPTGRELYELYLAPLAAALGPRVIETNTSVRSISRRGIDKVITHGRDKHPFLLTLEDAAGAWRTELARAVIDASGTWQSPNPLGASGIRVPGEARFADHIAYGIPDVLEAERKLYAGKVTLVVGGGHSAANAVLDLLTLAAAETGTRVLWAIRNTSLARIFGGGAADQLPARGELGTRLRRAVEARRLQVTLGFKAESVRSSADGLLVAGRVGADETVVGPVDRILVSTGQRPDLELARELRTDPDPWLECPRGLAAQIDPNLHACGTVMPHGYRQLAQPEPGYFAVGAKSYGRAPTFLMATGYEQVRSVVAHLAGDQAAADDVRLVLPETGICFDDLGADSPATCCTEAPPTCCPGAPSLERTPDILPAPESRP